jgi:hypothetical protein
MKIERKDKNLIIKIPEDVLEIEELQELLDYLRFRSITSKSKATEKNIEEIANEIDSSWWSKNKERFMK